MIDSQPSPAVSPAPSTDLATPAGAGPQDNEPRQLVLLDADDALTCTGELCLPAVAPR